MKTNKLIKPATKSTIFKFSQLSLAQNFAHRAIGGAMIVKGDDGKFWVTTMADGERLIRSGFSVTK